MAGKSTPITEEEADEKEFDLESWLRTGMRGLRRSIKRRPPMVPEEFATHTRAARKEMLLAVRSLLDAAIHEVEQSGEPDHG